MNKAQFEKEVKARVEFKMNEFLTSLKNRVAFKYRDAFDMSRESQHIWKAWEELEGMVKKEMLMETPYDNMSTQNKNKAKNHAVERLIEGMGLVGKRDYQQKVNLIVSTIEKAQNY